MHALVKTAFTRLYALDPDEEERKMSDGGNDSQEGVEMNVTTDASIPPAVPPPPEATITEAEPSPEGTQDESEKLSEPETAPEVERPPEIEAAEVEVEAEGIRQKCKFAVRYQ